MQASCQVYVNGILKRHFLKSVYALQTMATILASASVTYRVTVSSGGNSYIVVGIVMQL